MGGTVKKGNGHRNPSPSRKNSAEIRRERIGQTVAAICGMAAEDRLLNALSGKFGDDPPWFCGARRALGCEDKNKRTDVIVETTYGDVCIDVKSSPEHLGNISKGENVLTLILPSGLEGRALRVHVLVEVAAHLQKTSYMFGVFAALEISRKFPWSK